MNWMHEYQYPELYDCEYGYSTSDFDIFGNHLKFGDALDVACGTGRLTIELAKKGLRCTGIDENKLMLIEAQKKSHALDLDVSFLQYDMKHFQLGRTFDLVTMAGNSFQALLNETDQKTCLACIHQHLKSQGFFIFNTRNTTPDEMKTTKRFEYWHDFIDPKGHHVNVYGMQHYDAANDIVVYTTKRVWSTHETLSNVTLKFTDSNTLSNLLKQSGFDILEQYGDFDRGMFDPYHSKDIIMVCQKK